jgi:putative aldouronate transport system permease protein
MTRKRKKTPPQSLGTSTWQGAIGSHKIYASRQLYLFVLPGIILLILFRYLPMYGVQIGFRDYSFVKGFFGSKWVGMKHFIRFFSSYNFWPMMKNTILLSFGQLLFGFPAPIIVALSLNLLHQQRYKRFIQTAIFAPYFISIVVLVGMLFTFLSPSTGVINFIISKLGGESLFFMGEAGYFRPIYIISNIWRNTGYGTILYLGALSNVSPDLHEAATVDGATKFQRMLAIDIPAILPVAIVLLILNAGRMISIGFQQTLLMQTPLNIQSSEIISTYVYKSGLLNGQYSFATAVGLFEAVINITLLLSMNRLSRKFSDSSLW